MVKAEELNGKQFDAVIIGGGLGGLQCGYILSKKGLKVCILEQNMVLGGALQSFKRRVHNQNGGCMQETGNVMAEFDTGLHYVGGLDQGETLHSIFSYFDLLKLPWHKMDPDSFDEVIINGQSYLYSNGYDAFARRMTDYFPHQKENIIRYCKLLEEVGKTLPKSLEPREADNVYTQSLFAQSAYSYLKETITDPLLIEVLSGTSLKMELTPNLPLYTFAQINSSFIQSAYRLNGGGNLISDSLCSSIEKMGGIVSTRARVDEIKELESNNQASGLHSGNSCGLQLIVNGSVEIMARSVISNLHPAATLELVKESAHIRKIYRNRINRLENTTGMFTVNLALKDGMVEYKDRNCYIYTMNEGESLWTNYRKYTSGQPVSGEPNTTGNRAAGADNIDSMLISYYSREKGVKSANFAKQLDLLVPMSWSEVEMFKGTRPGHRGEEYETIKEKRAEQCIEFAQNAIPGLKDMVTDIYTSTPLTYNNYTATACGSAYGIRKDYNNLMQTLLTPKTPVPNLYLTGQNLNLHGVLGVSMTSFFTCAEIIGMEAATDGLFFEK
ncbi:MAG: NAD(P)/FAD-dependent oxidoreductase [Bacteroidales bacterium]|nr:NAD(P)/FAD-dependent oxidoreductase [Bacteroidales bacterium]